MARQKIVEFPGFNLLLISLKNNFWFVLAIQNFRNLSRFQSACYLCLWCDFVMHPLGEI